MLEKDIEKIILTKLNLSGLGFFWKNATVGVYDKGKGTYRRPGAFQITGVSDIIGVTRDGRAVFLEVKTPKGKTTKNQEAFLDKVGYWGAIAGVVRSYEDAYLLLTSS